MPLANKFPVVREHTGDPAQERMQNERGLIETFLNGIAFLRGRLIDGSISAGTQRGDGTGPGVVIGLTATLIEHGLGRPPRGYLVLAQYDYAVPFCFALDAQQPTDTSRSVALIASGGFPRVKLWIW